MAKYRKTYFPLFILIFHWLFFAQATAQKLLFDEVDLTISSPNYSDRARVRLNEIATNGYDLGLDAVKFLSTNTNVPQLYSRVTVPAGTYTFSVNSLPRNVSGVTDISLALRYGEKGTYTITAADILERTPSCTEISLIDATAGKTVNLKTTPTYTFTSTATPNTTTTTRFKLRISSEVPYVAIAANSDKITCTYPTVTLTANATSGCTYMWSTGAVTPSIDVAEAGEYGVTVTYPSNGKTATDTKVITLDTIKPTVNITSPADEINCNISSIRLTTVASNVSYLWSGSGSTLSYITVNQPDNYIVTVTDLTNGCTATAEKTITKNITPPEVEIVAPITEITCARPSVDLTAVAENVSYLWSSEHISSSEPIINVSRAANYMLMVKDLNNGCSSTAHKVITIDTIPPTVEIIAQDTVLTCSIKEITLTAVANNVSYLWSTEQVVDEINVTIPNTYSVQVTDTQNGCTTTAEKLITQNITKPTVEIVVPTTELNCNITSIDLIAEVEPENVSYLWSTNDNTPMISVTTPDEYSLIVTDLDNGCTSDAEIIITENKVTPTVRIISSATELNCIYDSIDLTAEADNVSYLWSTGEETSDITVWEADTYSVTVTDLDNGCTSTYEKRITEDYSVPEFDIDASAEKLNSTYPTITLSVIPFSAENTYLWTTQSEESQIIVDSPDTYGVSVMLISNGCVAYKEIEIIKEDDPTKSSLNEPKNIVIYILNNSFYFEGIDGSAELKVFDIMGRLVLSNNQLFNAQHVKSPGNGIYLLKLNNKNYNFYAKVFLVQK
jgi:hypothetical protein